MSREFFCAYHTYLEAVELLSDAECGRLFKALLKFSALGEVSELHGNEQYLYALMKGQIMRDAQRYDDKCEVNRQNGRKRTVANGSERKRTVANGSERKRTVANALQEKGKEKKEGEEKEKEGEEKGEEEGEGNRAHAREAFPPISPAALVQLFNSTCKSLNRVIMPLSEQRKDALYARYVDVGADMNAMKKIFEVIEASDFLCGRKSGKDKPPFKADFDWIMDPEHFHKIREGKYTDAVPVSAKRCEQSYDISEIEEQLDAELWNDGDYTMDTLWADEEGTDDTSEIEARLNAEWFDTGEEST